MAQALYRKWRSQSFGEVFGQEAITRTLKNAVKNKRFSHAYLFCGPRGTGKTSTGRILAKALNCLNPQDGEPCNECRMCVAMNEGRLIDLIEIDAASNRGIDEIRDLRDKIRFAPNEANYKVYIVDEVHMLTDQAFNALLKTLEEPPPHAIFILATTEAHKLPATIISRCQRFDFRRIRPDAAIARLQEIRDAENIQADDAALSLIVKSASGSLRDANNLLDQLVSFYGSAFTAEDVEEMLGVTNDERARLIAAAALRGDLAEGLSLISNVAAEGVDLRQFNREIVEALRCVLLIQSGAGALVDVAEDERTLLDSLAETVPADRTARITRLFSEVDLRNETLATLPLELALVDSIHSPAEAPAGPAPTHVTSTSSPRPATQRDFAPREELPQDAPPREVPRRERPPEPARRAPEGPLVLTGDLKQRERDLLRRLGNADARLVIRFRPLGRFVSIEDTRVEFEAKNDFLRDRAERDRAHVESLLASIFGHPVAFSVTLSSTERPAAPRTDPMAELIHSPLIQHAMTQHGAKPYPQESPE